MDRSLARSIALLTLAVALLGCGGGGGDDEPSAGDERRGSSTSTAEAREVVSAAAAASEAAAIKLGDLGQPWTQYEPAKGIAASDPESCMARAGIYEPLAEDARYQGAMFKRGDASYFVQSNAVTFPDQEAADAMVERFTTPEHASCTTERRTSEASSTAGAPEGSSWRLSDTFVAPPEGGEGGYAASNHYQFQALVDGQLQDANGSIQEILYRRGATVLFVSVQRLAAEGDPADLAAIGNEEVIAASQKAIARA